MVEKRLYFVLIMLSFEKLVMHNSTYNTTYYVQCMYNNCIASSEICSLAKLRKTRCVKCLPALPVIAQLKIGNLLASCRQFFVDYSGKAIFEAIDKRKATVTSV